MLEADFYGKLLPTHPDIMAILRDINPLRLRHPAGGAQAASPKCRACISPSKACNPHLREARKGSAQPQRGQERGSDGLHAAHDFIVPKSMYTYPCEIRYVVRRGSQSNPRPTAVRARRVSEDHPRQEKASGMFAAGFCILSRTLERRTQPPSSTAKTS